LQAALAGLVGRAVPGLAIPFVNVTDTRWTVGTGWSYSALGPDVGWGARAAWAGISGAAGTVTFTPGVTCDTFDIYYAQAAGQGTFGASIDGGGVTNTNAAGVSAVVKVTVTAPVGSGHVLTIAGPTGGGLYILGVDAYLSTKNAIRLANAGVASATTGNWASAGLFSSLACVKAYAPDLTIIMLGTNDAGAGVTAGTWTTNMQAVIAAALVSGDVLVTSVIPSSDPTKAALEAGYAAAAQTLPYGYVDVLARLVSYAADSAAGYAYDVDHLNANGYADVGGAIATAVISIVGPSPQTSDADWTAAALANSWVTYGPPFAPPGFRKDADGVVSLRGTIKSGTATAGTTLLTLPAGYRPPYTQIFVCASAETYGEVWVGTDGTVKIQAGTATWLSLDAVRFRSAT
jgi:lysophospholipase L1-like esterase